MVLLVKCLVTVLLVQCALAVTAQQHSAMKQSAAAGQEPCITAPTAPDCSSFSYPQSNAAADIGSLCKGMHFMAACSVAKACNASGAGPDGNPKGPGAAEVSKNNPNICDPFQHVVTVCKLDQGMSRMSGCSNFNTMCIPGSKVPTCTATGITVIPTSEKVNAQVRSICEEMTMDGCERCMPSWQEGKKWADCDLLDTYSWLCYQMPEMGQCTEWHAMCKEDPTLKFCYPSASGSGGSGGGGDSGSGSDPAAPGPVMKMYFFNEMPFYLLFKNWTPRTTADLVGAWLAIFCLGVFYEFLQMVYGKKEAEFWARRSARSAAAAMHMAAASQQGMDEESGGPLGEGVVSESENGRNAAAAAVYVSGGGSPYNCCNTPPKQATAPVAGNNSCCGGGGDGTISGVTSRPDSAASFDRSMGYRKKGGRKGLFGVLCGYMQPDLVAMDIVRGMARFVLAGIAYLLMLAAMCFNVPIFFAVIAGVAVGSMLFGRWRWSSQIAEGYSHCGCGSS